MYSRYRDRSIEFGEVSRNLLFNRLSGHSNADGPLDAL